MNRHFTQRAASSGETSGANRMNTHNPDSFRYRHRGVDSAPLQVERFPLSVRTLSSNSLFQGEHEIGIEHHGALYRLKITSQGKLILNK